MSSSTIEVMEGEEDLEMVLMQTDAQNSSVPLPSQIAGESSRTVAPAASSPPSQPALPFSLETTEEDMKAIEEVQPAGDIIFSPQDMVSFTRVKSNRGRKKKSLLHRRANAIALNMKEGIDYNSISVPVACEICNKIVANGKILLQHMSTHSEVKRFPCPHCPKSFTRIVHLKGHLPVHGIQKQFQCPICLQRFSRQDCVKVHMRLHDKTKCVFCDVCHKAFLTVGALNIHQRIHRGEKPFKCHVCGKCFTQKNHVITHIKRHTKINEDHYSKKLGPRIFQCEHCPRSFIRLSDYERHVQWNHGAIADSQVNEKVADHQENSFIPTSRLSINDLLPNYEKPKKIKYQSRKVMCTTSTQTDEEGGHIIVPSKYRTTSTMTSTSTQVSAPPTPRAPDDEIYENDIFDEGMDRNYSSDEEENFQSSQETSTLDQPIVEVVSHSTGNDEAFDAVLNNLKSDAEKSEEGSSQIPARKIVNPEAKNPLTPPSPPPVSKEAPPNLPTMSKVLSEKPKSLPGTLVRETVRQSNPPPSLTPASISKEPKPPNPQKVVIGRKFMENFNISNWKGKSARGRGRGRAKIKSVIGLTGATHLRLIRKSMMNYMAEGAEGEQKVEPEEPTQDPLGIENKSASEPPGESSRSKRQAKNKEHGKDFICPAKTCKICNSQKENSPSQPTAPKIVKISSEPSKEIKQEATPAPAPPTQTKKLLKFLISGDASALQGTNFKLLNEDEEGTNSLGLLDCTQLENPLPSFSQVESFPYLGPTTPSVISPPAELQSFCIPTFSCKLCGREFRFEGKLHRHIESVHQKKAIFSPDVKPGRSANYRYTYNPVSTTQPVFKEKIIMPQIKKPTPENPQIQALRSEWDDEEDDEEEGGNVEAEENERQTMEQFRLDEDEEEEEEEMEEDYEEEDMDGIMHRQIPYTTPIITRDITPVTNTTSDLFMGGVKIHLNKLSGLASEFMPESSVLYSKIPAATEKMVVQEPQDTLDSKCRKLLEKLFDSSLLLRCGINTDHVSAVLGRVLQHYGLKMIENYGQGQYEVLKYNLWRLIEWKVTMEQMEEFYTDGKSVEEMMDDIMFGKVPIIAHTEPDKQKDAASASVQDQAQPSTQADSTNQVQTLETVQIGENQLMLSQLSNVLTGHLNLGEGVTQVVLAQDVSPELLQGAHIVTIDPTTGQVLSQVTADQVILTASVPDDMEQPIQSGSGQVVASNTASTTVVSALPPGSILADSQQLVQQTSSIKIEKSQGRND